MKFHIRWMIAAFSLALMATGAVVFAQDKQQENAPKQNNQFFIERGGDVLIAAGQDGGPAMLPPMLPPKIAMSGEAMSVFVASEMGIGGKLIKGAPYSAQAVTESVQTLADGNRIVRKTTASVYRDSEGRTRQEQTVGNIGPYAMAGEPRQTIFINDPVAGTSYILDARDKTARKFNFIVRSGGSGKDQKSTVTVESVSAAGKANVETVVISGSEPRRRPMGSGERTWVGGVGAERTFNIPLKEPKTESLGKQVMDGVEVEGTRETITIAAGEIGNELPIQITTERWYSPELQVVVMRKHTDPLMGENTYRLTGINRSEPARSLFELPSDYTVKDPMDSNMRFKLEREMQRTKKKSDEQ